MSRYIDVNMLIKKYIDTDIKKFSNSDVKIVLENLKQNILKAPSIEPKRGEWIDKGWKGDWEFETGGRGNCWHEYECSECGFHKKGGKSNFCPSCGASMTEREGE